jgi:succinate dehydrogenase hydrophobic anchor subunit
VLTHDSHASDERVPGITSRFLPRATAVLAVSLVTVLSGVLLDAASADTPADWEKAPAVSGFDFLLVLLLIPLGLALVISFLAFVPSFVGDQGYQPGQSWRGESEWFGGPRKGIAAADEVTSDRLEAAASDTGSTSGKW